MAIFKKQGVYWIDYYASGQRKRERIGPCHSLAKEVLHKRKLEIAEGKFFPQRQKQVLGFSEMADLYWDLHAKQKPSALATSYHLKWLKQFFGNKPLNQIAVPDVLKYLNEVKERTGASTANRHHNIIRAVFNRAIEWEKFNGVNPAAKVKQFRVENARTRFLEKEAVPLLLAACDAELQPIVVCALMTGMRKGEILNLRWEDVDFQNGIVHVLETKSGEPREIPISAKLAEVLTAIRNGDGGKIFHISARALNSRLSKALKLAGIDNFRFHDLRHTFASHFIMWTNDLPATQKLLGHHSSRMTQRYAHLSQGHLKAEMQLFDAGWTPIWTPSQNADKSDTNKKTASGEGLPSENSTSEIWSGRWESNPHLDLGKVAFYH